MNRYWICPVCSEYVKGKGFKFVCVNEGCKQWVHRVCGGYTQKQLKELPQEELLCNLHKEPCIDIPEIVIPFQQSTVTSSTVTPSRPVTVPISNKADKVLKTPEDEKSCEGSLPDYFVLVNTGEIEFNKDEANGEDQDLNDANEIEVNKNNERNGDEDQDLHDAIEIDVNKDDEGNRDDDQDLNDAIEIDVNKDDEEIGDEDNMYDGEEVSLKFNGFVIFKARYENSPAGTTVHGRLLTSLEGQFFITKVLKKVKNYPYFDIDHHTVGEAIAWPLKGICKEKKKIVEKIGTEGQIPTVVDIVENRKRNPENWMINIKKRKVNSGEEVRFVKNKKEMIIKAKKMKGACKVTCRKKCNHEILPDQRQNIFDNFWKLGKKESQWAFIQSYVHAQKPERRRQKKFKAGENIKRRSGRMFSFKYFLPCEPKREVCQVMFLNTLGISKKVVLNVFQKKIENGCLQPDKRERKKGRMFTGKRVMKVIQHIKMFKCVPSHYVRKNSRYQYLAQELSVPEMHRMYKKWCADLKIKTESYDFYKWVFKSRFKLKFQKPKKDACATCTAYLNKPSRSEQEEEEQRKHQSDKAYTWKIKEERKKESEENDEVCCAAFDLQQVLLSPFGQAGDFYYSRRLKNHNFTIT